LSAATVVAAARPLGETAGYYFREASVVDLAELRHGGSPFVPSPAASSVSRSDRAPLAAVKEKKASDFAVESITS
jgi:hypothetical protein